jgi:hypothetical protein
MTVVLAAVDLVYTYVSKKYSTVKLPTGKRRER